MSKPQKKILLTPEEEHCFSPEELLADNGSLLFGFLSVFEEEPEKFSKEQIAQFLLGFYEMTIPDDPMRVQCHTKIRDITAEIFKEELKSRSEPHKLEVTHVLSKFRVSLPIAA
jgi:hypothetical protein